jgi:hypothetical protein
MPTSGFGGFIEGGVGSHGGRTLGGAVTLPLVKDKLTLHIEGYDTHFGTR